MHEVLWFLAGVGLVLIVALVIYIYVLANWMGNK